MFSAGKDHKSLQWIITCSGSPTWNEREQKYSKKQFYTTSDKGKSSTAFNRSHVNVGVNVGMTDKWYETGPEFGKPGGELGRNVRRNNSFPTVGVAAKTEFWAKFSLLFVKVIPLK